MNRRSLVALSMGLLLTVTACHKNQTPGEPPKPAGPGQTSTTSNPPPPTNPPPAPVTPVGSGSALDDNARIRVATMTDKIHFDYNEAEIRPEDTKRLDAKAGLMKQFPALRIRVTGHADERGSDQYNIALGLRRAAAAKAYLVQLGIDAGRIDVASLGREMPENPGHDEAAWTQNRRDEFDIIAGTQSLRAP